MIWLSGDLPALIERIEDNPMQSDRKITSIFFGLCLFAAACSSAGEEASPTPEPETVLTAAAQTANAQLTENAKPQPTTTVAPFPGGTDESVTPAAITGLTPESSPVGISSPAPTVATGGVDQAVFSADITIPDGSDFDPGEEFTKIWQLRNFQYP